MSRHRIVRTMNYSDEYDEYDDVYGHSVDEESSISPTDAQQWMYDRDRGQQSIASFITNNQDIKEESDQETETVADELYKKLRRDSDNFKMPTLNEGDQVLLESCMDEIRNVVGDSVLERQLVETIMKYKFDCTKALDAILNNATSDTPATSTSSRMPIETDSKPLSLTDLLKQRSSTSANQANKFKLPSIFGQKSTETTFTPPPLTAQLSTKFNNLSELANAHLSTNKLVNGVQKMSLSESINIPQSSKFVIPKLSGGDSSSVSSLSPSSFGDSLTPHETSLKKIMDLKRLHISKDIENMPPDNKSIDSNDSTFFDKQQFPIDLASALNGPNFSSSIIAPTKRIIEQIDFKFIDCDIAEKSNVQPLISQDCCLNIAHIVDEHFDNRTKCTTAFGKILCSKYKCKRQLSIQHGFVSKHQIKPFRFDTINTKPKSKTKPSK